MKLKNIFKIIGLTLFFVALIFFLYLQNPDADHEALTLLVCFGCILAFSGVCLIAGELFGKIETLETKVFWLEEEIKKLKK